MELRSYQRISEEADGDNDNNDDCDNNDNCVISPLQTHTSAINHSGNSSAAPTNTRENSPDILNIKILMGEQSKDIKIPKQASVSQLKSLVEPAYGVPASQQRYVFKGKPLRPNENSLASFNVTDGSVLHLFPLPASAPAATSDDSSIYDLSASSLSYPGNHIRGIPSHLMRPVHFVPEVVQSIREVKMWCYILIITSGMDIFTNLSYLGSTGHLGRGLLDSILKLAQTIFSFIGLYVGQLGLRCTTSAEADDIKQYVFSLSGLALVSVCLKAVWVVDVILLAKKGLREAHEEEEDLGQDDGRGEPGKGDGQYDGETGEDENHLSDSSFMIYFSIQAILMAVIAASMWVACVKRARSFQLTVRSYEGITTRV